MSGCECGEAVFDGASPAYRRALMAVIAINAGMFAIEATAVRLPVRRPSKPTRSISRATPPPML
jgi:hypothetical protein